MKYLKIVLGIILLLAILFIIKGILTPTVSYESEVVVNKPAKEAWAVMSDESTLAEWILGFKKTELVSGTANTVGAVSKIYIEERGQEMIMQETIKKIIPNKHLAMTFSMDFMDMDYEILFEEKDNKTVIKSNSTTKGNGMIAKSMVSFMKSAMKTQEDENMNKLKQLIEENTKNYFPVTVSEPLEETEK